MERYCTKCGEKLKDGARFCSRCGTPLNGVNRNDATPEEFDRLAGTLAEGALSVSKALTVILMAGTAAVCSMASFVMLISGVYLIYHFAVGKALVFPWLFAGSIGGFPLLVGGLMAVFITVLFAAAAVALFRCTSTFVKHGKKQVKAGESNENTKKDIGI